MTLPLIAPGVLAAGAARVRAVDRRLRDHVLQRGPTTTFPLFVWGAARVAMPPQINVIATMIFLVTVGGMILNVSGSSGARAAGRRVTL